MSSKRTKKQLGCCLLLWGFCFWCSTPWTFAQPYPSGSVQSFYLFGSESQLYLPIISLNETKHLRLELDYLVKEYNLNLYAEIKLCDATFHIVDEISSNYLTSLDRQYLTDAQQALTKFSPYYHLSIYPFSQSNLTRSGNYIIQIIDQDHPEVVLYTQPIIVYENRASVKVEVTSGGLSFKKKPSFQSHISISLSENVSDYNLQERMKVYTLHNGDWNTWQKKETPYLENLDTETWGINPSGEVIISYPPDYIIQTDNIELRTFNTSVAYLQENRLMLQVATDFQRQIPVNNNYTEYPSYNETQNSNSSVDKNISAEYLLCHFSFKPDGQDSPQQDIYLVGGFNQFRLDSTSKMIWNAKHKQLEQSITLKQGFYQYMYATKENGSYLPLASPSYDNTATQQLNAVVYLSSDVSEAPQVIGVGKTTF